MPRSTYSPGSKLNPVEDYSKMRRIIAEDPNWSLIIVPSLSNLCLQSIMKNFESMLLFPVPLSSTLLNTYLLYKCNVMQTCYRKAHIWRSHTHPETLCAWEVVYFPATASDSQPDQRWCLLEAMLRAAVGPLWLLSLWPQLETTVLWETLGEHYWAFYPRCYRDKNSSRDGASL